MRAPEAVVFATGVLAGSAAWWLVLTACVNGARRVASDALRRALDALAGAALAAIGLVANLRRAALGGTWNIRDVAQFDDLEHADLKARIVRTAAAAAA